MRAITIATILVFQLSGCMNNMEGHKALIDPNKAMALLLSPDTKMSDIKSAIAVLLLQERPEIEAVKTGAETGADGKLQCAYKFLKTGIMLKLVDGKFEGASKIMGATTLAQNALGNITGKAQVSQCETALSLLAASKL